MALPFTTEAADAALHLGLIVLQADEVIEGEFPQLLAGAVAPRTLRLTSSRVPSGAEVSLESLTAMAEVLPAAVALLPKESPLDVIGYACTSGATAIGEARVAELVRAVRPGVQVTNPLSAAKAALTALGLRRLGFVTPYVPTVSAALRDNLAAAGFEISAFGSFEVAEESVVARITPDSILRAILTVGETPECEGVFVACTNLRAAGIIAEAEARLGKPVITSNQALAWHMLRLAGIDTPLPERGRLFTLPLS